MSIAPLSPIDGQSAKSLVDLLPAQIPLARDEVNGELWVDVVDQLDGPGGLLSRVTDWDDLAAHALEPNVFHEAWQMLPAVRIFTPPKMRFAFIYRRSKRQDVAPRLCGFFPFLESGGGIKPRRWSLWEHDYSYVSVPLIRRGQEIDTWRALFEYFDHSPSPPALIDLPGQVGEGPLAQAMIQVLFDRRALIEYVETHVRALVKTPSDWMAYAASVMSTHQRRELRRHWRRLTEMGDLTERSLAPNQGRAVESWINSFLHLESLGWKGHLGTSFKEADGAAEYFREITRSAYSQGRLQMFGLFLDGEPIAMKVNFLASPGSYAFKIAYDERYSKFSPGVQLELENLRRLHETEGVEWMDSCASPNHFMINRMWKERRTIKHLRVSTGRVVGNVEIGVRTFLRSLLRSWRSLTGRQPGAAVAPPQAPTAASTEHPSSAQQPPGNTPQAHQA
ncbi:MAG: GNAT family N-acetyltransferase [Planctomycetaceae bacterium]